MDDRKCVADAVPEAGAVRYIKNKRNAFRFLDEGVRYGGTTSSELFGRYPL